MASRTLRRWRLRAGRHPGLALVALCLALGVAQPARAESGELTVGPSLTWAAWHGGRGGVFLEWGATRWLSAYGAVEAGISPHPAAAGEGLATVGATLLYDVIAWVPALTVSGGVIGGASWHGRGAVEAAVRRYVSPQLWLGVGGGAEWRQSGIRGLVSVSAGFGLER